MKLHRLLEQHWQQPRPWLNALLLPLSFLFERVAARRRKQYLHGARPSFRLPVPVIVVGNLHAGGSGKTPITAALVHSLQQRGINAGIISRGYGRISRSVHILNPHSTAAQAGDEPLLLYRQTRAPTAVGADRVAAAQALLAQHPELHMLIADDGLQHYRLQRDIEICVFPAADIGRRLHTLPAGSLREPPTRLDSVDFVVCSQGSRSDAERAAAHYALTCPVFYSRIHAAAPYRLADPSETLHSGSLKAGARCAAVAAIARPQRFFDTLTELGFPPDYTVVLPDHAAINPAQLPDADYIFITEKDAVKLAPDTTPTNLWVLPVRAEIAPDLAQSVLAQLDRAA